MRDEANAAGAAGPTPPRRATEAELATEPAAGRAAARPQVTEAEAATDNWRSSWASVSIEGLLHENHDRGAGALLEEGCSLFSVLDGHGTEGAALSHLCQRSLFDSVHHALVSEGKTPTAALTEAFANTAAALPSSPVDCRFSGTTAVVAMVRASREQGGSRELTIGWVGDSRAVLVRQRRSKTPVVQPVTRDHKPSDPKERRRLQECHATVRPSCMLNPINGRLVEVGCQRVWDSSEIYGIAMSRSLGDMQVHPFVISVPEISTRPLDEKDRLLVLATDGVWDVVQNEEIMELAAIGEGPNGTIDTESIAHAISEVARSRWDSASAGRRDDITCLVVDLRHPGVM